MCHIVSRYLLSHRVTRPLQAFDALLRVELNVLHLGAAILTYQPIFPSFLLLLLLLFLVYLLFKCVCVVIYFVVIVNEYN